ncbi:hypothetical protein ACTXT7_016129, partial [Hymenolepis weldensis]
IVNRLYTSFRFGSLEENQFRCLVFTFSLRSPRHDEIQLRHLSLLNKKPDVKISRRRPESARGLLTARPENDLSSIDRGDPLPTRHFAKFCPDRGRSLAVLGQSDPAAELRGQDLRTAYEEMLLSKQLCVPTKCDPMRAYCESFHISEVSILQHTHLCEAVRIEKLLQLACLGDLRPTALLIRMKLLAPGESFDTDL